MGEPQPPLEHVGLGDIGRVIECACHHKGMLGHRLGLEQITTSQKHPCKRAPRAWPVAGASDSLGNRNALPQHPLGLH